jgi:hypothetical protein
MSGVSGVVEAFGGPAAWRGEDLVGSEHWVHRLTAAEVGELDAALTHVESRRIPLGELHREDFPLSDLAATAARWAEEIDAGRGFVLVRGVPVDRYTVAQAGKRTAWMLRSLLA